MEMEDGKISLLVKIIMKIMKMKVIVKKIILMVDGPGNTHRSYENEGDGEEDYIG